MYWFHYCQKASEHRLEFLFPDPASLSDVLPPDDIFLSLQNCFMPPSNMRSRQRMFPITSLQRFVGKSSGFLRFTKFDDTFLVWISTMRKALHEFYFTYLSIEVIWAPYEVQTCAEHLWATNRKLCGGESCCVTSLITFLPHHVLKCMHWIGIKSRRQKTFCVTAKLSFWRYKKN